jgi:hypothetical protein
MSELTWTSEKPTEPGWYWHRISVHTKPTFVKMWQDENDGGRLVFTGDSNGFPAKIGSAVPAEKLRGQWAGPIPEPVEAK